MKIQVRAFIALVTICTAACNDTSLAEAPVATPTPEEPNAAPVAIIDAATSEYTPLDTAHFDGSASHDPDGAIVSYAWTIVERPSGSNSTIQTLDAGAVAELFVDFAGDYVVELKVTDDDGVTGATTYAFSAIPWQTVHVELAWDIDQVDVDLHLVDTTSGGQFQAEPGDCFYSNKTPDWGVPGPQNDPALDIDDVDGFGPENINIAQPANGATYRIFVHYYADDGFGATNATIKIYLNGELHFEQIKNLEMTDRVWDVATIAWPSGQITEIGAVGDESAF
jgi:hypothetical protein